MNIRFFLLLFLVFMLPVTSATQHEITIIGSLGRRGKPSGVGIHTATFLRLLKQHTRVYYQSTNTIPPKKYSDELLRNVIINRNVSEQVTTPVVIFTQFDHAYELDKHVINIAYATWESTELPKTLTRSFNKFDAVIVTDEFLIQVFKDSGVIKPIFVLPPALDLINLLGQPIKKIAHTPFTFGCVASFCARKNLFFLIKTFQAAFGNSHSVRLLIHSNQVFQDGERQIIAYIKNRNITNVIIDHHSYDSTQLVELYKKFDCYILLSKGEGFSITPREAMSLGIPCILANNTGQETICKTGLVIGVPIDKAEPVSSIQMGNNGYWFTTKTPDAIDAMRDVYRHYTKHIELATQRREWVKQYLSENLRARYVSIINPQQVILCDVNQIGENFIKTNSKELYDKYLNLGTL